MSLIPNNEIKKHRSYDEAGYIFEWKGEIFRAIHPSHASHVRKLFECGLIADLVEQRLFPISAMTEYKTDDSELVVSHERIPVISIPGEWSFSMLRDAGLVILRVNRIARKYGFQTIDAHGFNVTFRNGRPLYIDLGSFIPIANDIVSGDKGWRPYGEYCRSILAPLKLWSAGDSYFARQSLHGEQLPMTTYWRHRWSILRLLPLKLLRSFESGFYRWKALNTAPIDRFNMLMSVSAKRERLGKLILSLDKLRLLPFLGVDLDRLIQKTQSTAPPSIPSAWAAYHSGSEITPRHKRILEIISAHGVQSILDMAGNAGFVSRLIASANPDIRIVCADYDENAIDVLYNSLKETESNINPVLMNFSISISDTKFSPAWERFKSQQVMALALTHHLFLKQGMTIDFVMHRLSQYTNEFVMVEFMPMGLYSSAYDKLPQVPDWYNIEWFRNGFTKHFDLIHEEEVGLNRTLFFGRLKAPL